MPPVEVQGLICSPARKGVEGKPSFVETSSKGLGQDTYFLCKKAFPWLLFTYTFYLRYGFAPLGFIGLSSFVGLPPHSSFCSSRHRTRVPPAGHPQIWLQVAGAPDVGTQEDFRF